MLLNLGTKVLTLIEKVEKYLTFYSNFNFTSFSLEHENKNLEILTLRLELVT